MKTRRPARFPPFSLVENLALWEGSWAVVVGVSVVSYNMYVLPWIDLISRNCLPGV